jgi:diadenosine tetraphosphate (Ap4A) HIT family hydrolase
MAIVPALSRALMKATNTEAFNIMLNNGAIAGQGTTMCSFTNLR